MLQTLARRPLCQLLLVCGACFGGDADSGGAPHATSAVLVGNIFLTPMRIDAAGGPLVAIDTGSPIVVLAPETLPGSYVRGAGRLRSVEWLGETFRDLSFIGDTLLTGSVDGSPIGGVAGCTVLCDRELFLNYRDREAAFGTADTVAGVDAPTAVPFELAGGGTASYPRTGDVLEMPASRILVDGTVEGLTVRMLLDTGASMTMLRQGFFTEVFDDGRPTVTVPMVSMAGATNGQMFRVETLAVGDASVTDGLVAVSSSIDSLLGAIGLETGDSVDGVIGGTFLREFAVTIDYPTRTVRLARYQTRDHIADEALRIGLDASLPSASATYLRIDAVYAGTDAEAQGVTVADRILAIGGESVEGKVGPQVLEMLSGSLGSQKSVLFGCAAEGADSCSSFEGERMLRVDYDRLAD